MTTQPPSQVLTMKIGNKYNWRNQPDRLVYLVYLGKVCAWHQFKKIGDPRGVWTEVLDSALHMIEEIASAPPSQAPDAADEQRKEFWRQHDESLHLTGHAPTMFDMWLIGKGYMDTNHRSIATTPSAPEPQPEAVAWIDPADLETLGADGWCVVQQSQPSTDWLKLVFTTPQPAAKPASPALEAAARGLLTYFIDMGNSGDCGFWNPEKMPEVIALRAALPPLA